MLVVAGFLQLTSASQETSSFASFVASLVYSQASVPSRSAATAAARGAKGKPLGTCSTLPFGFSFRTNQPLSCVICRLRLRLQPVASGSSKTARCLRRELEERDRRAWYAVGVILFFGAEGWWDGRREGAVGESFRSDDDPRSFSFAGDNSEPLPQLLIRGLRNMPCVRARLPDFKREELPCSDSCLPPFFSRSPGGSHLLPPLLLQLLSLTHPFPSVASGSGVGSPSSLSP